MIKTYTLKRQQLIRRPLDEVFPFFSRPENLGLLTPPSLGFQMLTPAPIHMKDGALIDYAINLYGMHLRWTTVITHFDPPHAFADVQLRGPYSFWHHTHTFVESGNGTVATDEVRYAIPFGFIGTIVEHLLVKRQLKAIFDFRERQIETIFPGS